MALAAVAVALSGCASSQPPSESASAARSTSPTSSVTNPGTATPSAVVAPRVTVVAAGAAASPTGTLLFVIVANGDAVAASAVQITATAASANGGTPLQGSALIANLAPGETQAAVIAVTVPTGDSLGAISASASAAGESTYRNPLTAGEARFIDDPITPSISMTISGAAPVSSAVVVAVCWVGSKIVGGGIKEKVAVAHAGSQTVNIQAALTAAPNTCSGYARPE